MYGNPFMSQQSNIDKIDMQIRELERLKQGYAQTQQPIQNIINTNGSNIEFEARFLNENEKVEEILVQRKTCFISPQNGFIKIKELNGNITTYDLVIPKTPEQLKIEELERRLEKYEHEYVGTNNEINESTTDDIKSNESSTKTNSRTISKKSE